jgi:hypothetical protein
MEKNKSKEANRIINNKSNFQHIPINYTSNKLKSFLKPPVIRKEYLTNTNTNTNINIDNINSSNLQKEQIQSHIKHNEKQMQNSNNNSNNNYKIPQKEISGILLIIKRNKKK